MSTKKIEIDQLSWDAAFALAKFAKERAEELAKEAAQKLDFEPVNENSKAYFEYVKAKQREDSAALFAFARQIMESGPSHSASFIELKNADKESSVS